MTWTELDTEIMDTVRANPGCTTRQICRTLGVEGHDGNYQLIRRHTVSLERYGMLSVQIDDTKLRTKHWRAVE